MLSPHRCYLGEPGHRSRIEAFSSLAEATCYSVQLSPESSFAMVQLRRLVLPMPRLVPCSQALVNPLGPHKDLQLSSVHPSHLWSPVSPWRMHSLSLLSRTCSPGHITQCLGLGMEVPWGSESQALPWETLEIKCVLAVLSA